MTEHLNSGTVRSPLRRTKLPFSPAIAHFVLAIVVVVAMTSATVVAAKEEAEDDVWEGVELLFVESGRRLVDLQNASEAITAFSSDDLRDKGLANFDDLQYSVPNLFTGGGLSKTTLRGVGSEIVGPGTDPGFVVHVNGVYTARAATGSSDYFDIERISVFRGPQGTLWGRNSTGGAINIVTARPTYEFATEADVEYESFTEGAHAVRTRGMLNIPIVEDKFAARIAFLHYSNDGLTLNESGSGDQRVNDAEDFSLRLSLRWQPNEDWTIDVIGSVLKANGAGEAPKFAGPFFSPDPVTRAGVGPGVNYNGALPNPSNPYRGTSDERSDRDSTIYAATVLVDYKGTGFEAQSITGYQSSDFETHRDADGSSLPIATRDLEDISRQVSQEFLIQSDWDQAVDFTVGAIYQYDWTPRTTVRGENAQNTDDSRNFRLAPFSIVTRQSLVDGCMLSALFLCPPTKPRGVVRENFIRAFSRVDNHVFGVYANATWEIIKDLRLSAGGRYSYTHRKWDDKTVVQTFVATSPRNGLQVLRLGQQQQGSWESGTWKLTLDYRLLENHLLWASAGTGARSGGFNFIDKESFGQETIFAVEAGFKSSFLDRRITLDVSGFWYDWQDPQIRGTADNLPLTTNAPSAESYGIEVEARIVPVPNFEITASFGWLEATYDQQFRNLDRTTPNYESDLGGRYPTVDIEGNRLPRSPRFNASIGVQYTFEVPSLGAMTPRVDFYYRGALAFRQFGDSLDEQEAYTRTDARITWRPPGENLWIELFMRNLENNHVKTNQDIFENVYRLHYYAAPRSGGLSVGFDY